MTAQNVIYLVDDDPVARQAVSQMLEKAALRVTAFPAAQEFLEQCSRVHPCCLLADVNLPDLGGPGLLRNLTERQIDIPVIFTTSTNDLPTAVQVMKMGACDLLQKPLDPEQLISSVQSALAKSAARLKRRRREDELLRRLKRLTPREREVMELVAEGLANKQIARRLGVSEKTVEVHRSRVMSKMEARNLPELVRQEAGLRDLAR